MLGRLVKISLNKQVHQLKGVFTHSWFPPTHFHEFFLSIHKTTPQHGSNSRIVNCFLPVQTTAWLHLFVVALKQRNRHATTKGCACSVNAITLNTTKPQYYKSVTSCIALQFNDLRNQFSQMSDIFLALSGINSQPESFDPLHQVCLVFLLHLPSDELF